MMKYSTISPHFEVSIPTNIQLSLTEKHGVNNVNISQLLHLRTLAQQHLSTLIFATLLRQLQQAVSSSVARTSRQRKVNFHRASERNRHGRANFGV
jgi:hypothetical protein